MNRDDVVPPLVLQADYLETPMLLFGGDALALSSYVGLVTYGPLELPSQPPKSLIILYPGKSEFKNVAVKVKDALENGYKRYFPRSFKTIFRVDVDLELVEIDTSKYSLHRSDETATEYYTKFIEVCGDKDECLPMILMNKVPEGLEMSLYTEVKSKFTLSGIPIQVFTYETFSDQEKFRWSVFPLALQIFVKMGGVPFVLKGDSLSIPEDEKVLILGLGLSKVSLRQKEATYVAFTTVFESNGRWRLIKWSPQPYNRGLLIQLIRNTIVNTVDEVLSNYLVSKPVKLHVIVHYSGKNISVDEETVLMSACQDLRQVRGIDVKPYIVKIQESMYVSYDTENECIKDRVPTNLPNVGTVIKLKDDLYLLYTAGCVTVQTPEGGVICRPNARGSPSPLIVSIKRLEGVKYELKDLDLIKSVFLMARMNYMSINNPVSKLPITVKYTKSLAYMTHKILGSIVRGHSERASASIDSLIPERLKNKLWFI
ncbi:MAG: Piwi domain-containing protein [Zestosphaera sp.]